MQNNPPQITETNLPGVLLLTPPQYADARGYFSEIYNPDTFSALGITTIFTQDSVSFSHKNVIRGMHFQSAPHAQDKLVRCARGKVYDVAADIDPASPTYGDYVGFELTDELQQMLFIPGKYAHGFCVLSDEALIEYKIAGPQVPSAARGVLFNDPVLSIDWPVADPILSEKDGGWSPLPRL